MRSPGLILLMLIAFLGNAFADNTVREYSRMTVSQFQKAIERENNIETLRTLNAELPKVLERVKNIEPRSPAERIRKERDIKELSEKLGSVRTRREKLKDVGPTNGIEDQKSKVSKYKNCRYVEGAAHRFNRGGGGSCLSETICVGTVVCQLDGAELEPQIAVCQAQNKAKGSDSYSCPSATDCISSGDINLTKDNPISNERHGRSAPLSSEGAGSAQ